jgi:hypothetical protein
MSNLKHDIKDFEQSGNRVNCEFVIPDCLGLPKNTLDEPNSKSHPELRRTNFVDLLTSICSSTKLNWSTVLTAILGQYLPKKDPFRRQLEMIRVNKKIRDQKKGSTPSSRQYKRDHANVSSLNTSLLHSPKPKHTKAYSKS